jgi:hypothetical protein
MWREVIVNVELEEQETTTTTTNNNDDRLVLV